MAKLTNSSKANIGITSGVVSIVLGGGSVVLFMVYLIVTIFASIGLGTYEKGTPQWVEQSALGRQYETISYIFLALSIVLFVLGIVLLVVFIKKKRQIKKAQTADINTEAK